MASEGCVSGAALLSATPAAFCCEPTARPAKPSARGEGSLRPQGWQLTRALAGYLALCFQAQNSLSNPAPLKGAEP